MKNLIICIVATYGPMINMMIIIGTHCWDHIPARAIYSWQGCDIWRGGSMIPETTALCPIAHSKFAHLPIEMNKYPCWCNLIYHIFVDIPLIEPPCPADPSSKRLSMSSPILYIMKNSNQNCPKSTIDV